VKRKVIIFASLSIFLIALVPVASIAQQQTAPLAPTVTAPAQIPAAVAPAPAASAAPAPPASPVVLPTTESPTPSATMAPNPNISNVDQLGLPSPVQQPTQQPDQVPAKVLAPTVLPAQPVPAVTQALPAQTIQKQIQTSPLASEEQTQQLPPPLQIPPAVPPAAPTVQVPQPAPVQPSQPVAPAPAAPASQVQPVQPTVQVQPVQPANVAPVKLPAEPQQQQEKAVIVGRINEISSGELQRLVAEEKDWVPIDKDTPFGIGDAIASAPGTKAVATFPNNVIVRIGDNVLMQMLKLDAETVETYLGAGTARFYNLGSATVKCETPMGYILSGPSSTFDVKVGEDTAEVIAVNGSVGFYKDNNKYDVIAGQVPILASRDMVTAGTPRSDADWINWNNQQDNLWNTRMIKGAASRKYLPKSLHQEAASLEENGKWVSAQYEGQNRTFWQPTNVAPGWQPYVNGRWVEYGGDNVWVPNESFGYVTHHYGNWVNINGSWVWAPPVEHYVVGSPYLPIYDTWYPGRVAWADYGDYVGWVPLAYSEPYYSPYWDRYYGYYGYHHGYYPYPDYYRYGYGYGYGYNHISINNYNYYGHGYGTFVGRHDLYHSFSGYHGVRLADHSRFANLRAGRLSSRGFGRDRFRSSARAANFKPDKSFGNRMGGGRFNKGQPARLGNFASGKRNAFQKKGNFSGRDNAGKNPIFGKRDNKSLMQNKVFQQKVGQQAGKRNQGVFNQQKKNQPGIRNQKNVQRNQPGQLNKNRKNQLPRQQRVEQRQQQPRQQQRQQRFEQRQQQRQQRVEQRQQQPRQQPQRSNNSGNRSHNKKNNK